MDNTNGVIREIEYGDSRALDGLITLLGPRFMLPKAGVIRPGIMALKSGCSERDVRVYEKMVREGRDWDEIEKELKADNDGKSKLIPRNVDYFAVHPKDCKRKDDVERILELYGDPDGKLRSFPVVFPTNEWWNVIPHSLRAFGENGLKYKSDFRKNGGGATFRVCTYPVNAAPGKRQFGGRKWAERPCEPDECPEYQSGSCSFGGVIQFYIPGIKGIGAWVLPTGSWYSLLNVKSTIEVVSRITGGKIAGTFGGRPIFRIKKVKETVTRIDVKTGKPVKTLQWLINLEADVDMAELSARFEKDEVLSRGARAANVLAGRPPEDIDKSIESASVSEPGVAAFTETTDGTKDGKKNGDGSAGDRLTGNVLVLWKAISGMHGTNSERRKKLKELAGVESFFNLTEERASDALERLNGAALH